MRHAKFRKIAESLNQRGDLLQLILIAVVLALGINLFSSLIYFYFTNVAFFIGLVLVGLPILFLAVGFAKGHTIEQKLKCVFVVDNADNSLVKIARYDFSEDLTKAIKGAFLENRALLNSWNQDPLGRAEGKHEEKSEKSKKTGKGFFSVIRMEIIDEDEEQEKKSRRIIREGVEFVILNALSLHLSDYFNGFSNREEFVTELVRQDFPDLLLQNRIIALLSSPIEDRVGFKEFVPPKDVLADQIETVYGPGGLIYERFSLILPRGTRFSRSEPGLLLLENERLNLKIGIDFSGYSMNLPFGFEELYLDKKPLSISPYLVTIFLGVEIKPFALFRRLGWEYHLWIDSFTDSIRKDFSFGEFLKTIG